MLYTIFPGDFGEGGHGHDPGNLNSRSSLEDGRRVFEDLQFRRIGGRCNPVSKRRTYCGPVIPRRRKGKVYNRDVCDDTLLGPLPPSPNVFRFQVDYGARSPT